MTWPTCDRCPNPTPARWTVTAGPDKTMAAHTVTYCVRHLGAVQRDVRTYPYRETRAAQQGDRTHTGDEQAGLW